jgi:hypothetical protein
MTFSCINLGVPIAIVVRNFSRIREISSFSKIAKVYLLKHILAANGQLTEINNAESVYSVRI